MRSKRGFTLVEILVTVTILTILASIGMVVYASVQSKNRDNIRRSDLSNLKLILHLYRRDKSNFIPWTNPNDGTSTQLLWSASVADPTLGADGLASNSLKNVLTPKYITKVPRDPRFTTVSDDYYLRITPTSFILSTKLETPTTEVLTCIPEAGRNYCVME